MALPSKKDVQYIKRKLKLWHNGNVEYDEYPSRNYKEFRRALKRLCDFFKIPTPKINFYNDLGGSETEILGQCTASGELRLLLPYNYENFRAWCKVFFHEFGHYIYYANAEKKANEFERRMMHRW